MKEDTIKEASLTDIWRLPLVLVGVLITALLLIYYPTTLSMIHIWNSSETFTHGYLILPITLWLIWHNKHHFYSLQPRPNYYAIPLLLIASFGWLIAYFVDVNVIQQIALVSMIPLIVFGVLGWQVVKAAAFPLFFLIFAVPMGEALVPTLIDFTADFTVAMVQMTGIPIYREGTFFQLPTGNWSVVEACSGVRYLIASVTLGFLYAYLTYQSPYRRAAFILVAIIVPVIANGLRAFMIVMIGHFSGMKLAVGVDHLIYGWIFFGIVIALMFYIGSFWREDEKEIDDEVRPVKMVGASANNKKIVAAAFIALLVVSLLPMKAYTDKIEVADTEVVIQAPTSNIWKKTDQLISDWTPRFKNTDATLVQNYQKGSESIDLFVGYYIAQRDEAQLVTSINVLTEEKDEWQNIGEAIIELQFSGGSKKVPLAHLKQGGKEILVAYFYYIDGKVITNDYLAKLLEAKNRILGGDPSASIVAISAELSENREQAIEQIRFFAKDVNKAIFNSIKSAKSE